MIKNNIDVFGGNPEYVTYLSVRLVVSTGLSVIPVSQRKKNW